MFLFVMACSTPPEDLEWDAVGETHPLAGEASPEFSLEDVNPTSASFGEFLGPATQAGQVSALYFGHST